MAAFYESDILTLKHLEDDNLNTIVIDIGSETIRAGYAINHHKEPELEIPSVVGEVIQENQVSKFYVGTENLTAREGMQLKPLVYDTHVDNFDLLEKVFEFIIKRLNCDPSDYMFLFSEGVHQTVKERSKLAEIMFEKFKCKAIYPKTSAVLQLVSAGMSSGLVIDSGASHTTVTPVVELYALKSGARKADIGGNLILDECMNYFENKKIDLVPNYMIKDKKFTFPDKPAIWRAKDPVINVSSTYLRWVQHNIAKDFAANVLCINPHPLTKFDAFQKTYYSFPHGYTKSIGHERYEIPECLFDTGYMSCTSEVMPIQDMVFSVLDDTDPSLRNTFEKNMLVTGGNSNLSGFDARLGFEINQKLGIVKLKTSGTFNRKFDAFAGGAVMATNPRFIWSWYSSQEYHDGSKRLHEL